MICEKYFSLINGNGTLMVMDAHIIAKFNYKLRKILIIHSPASSCKEPRILVCFGVLRICGRNDDAAAKSVRAPITAIATPIPIVTVLACHQTLGMSQKLQRNIAYDKKKLFNNLIEIFHIF